MNGVAIRENGARMTLVGHLQELRQRIIKSLLALFAAAAGCYYHVDTLLPWLIVPAGKLYYMNPAEAFFTYCKVALVGGLLISLPVIMYQFWAFLLPAMTSRELSAGFLLVPLSVALFYGGVIFAYQFVVPAAVGFFSGFSSEFLQPMFSLGQYISLVISLLFPFGLIFEMPLLIVALVRCGIISVGTLTAYRKYAVIAAFILGGIISPTPDIVGQAMLAIPLLLLYEISLLICRCFPG